MDKRLVFHYLDGKVDAEIFLAASQHPSEQTDALQARCNELVREGGLFRSIYVHRNHAQG